MTELHDLTAYEQWGGLQRGEFSPRDLVDHYLARIEKLDPHVGAFTTVTVPEARERATQLMSDDRRVAPLWGLPLAEKDLWTRRGVTTTYGSKFFENNVPQESSQLVHQLDDAGTISLGKTRTPEFGLTAYTESPVAPPTRNPWNLKLGAGGSSGGAAAAVAAGMLPFAPGSDGGGSIRIPAAACGLVGLKPSRGLVPDGSGQDTFAGLAVAGPIARTVADAALLLDGMIRRQGGKIASNYTLRAPDHQQPFLAAAIRGEGRFQLGFTTTSPWDDICDITIDPAATTALRHALTQFDNSGHGIEEMHLEPDPRHAAAFRTVWEAGASTIPVEADDTQNLTPITQCLLTRGRQLSARALAEALTALAACERSLIRQLCRFDAVLTPALAKPPRPIGWFDAVDCERNFVQQIQFTPFTSLANVSGLPAITLPVTETESGIPMGVQLIGRPGGEATLLALGAQLERRVRMTRKPSLW